MNKIIKKTDNIIKFPKSLNKLEKQVEAILFAADEPLDIETIEKRVQSTNNIKKVLENLQKDYLMVHKLIYLFVNAAPRVYEKKFHDQHLVQSF